MCEPSNGLNQPLTAPRLIAFAHRVMSAYAHKVLIRAGATDTGESSDVITVEEAAELSGLSEQTIRRRCKSGEIRANKIGKQWLVHATEFESSIPRRKRSTTTSPSPIFDHRKAANHIRRTDLSELWVPDILRMRDYFADDTAAISDAERRIEDGRFGSASRILVPKTLYSNRPGTNLELVDRIAFQSVVNSFARQLDQKLPDNVYSSRLSVDPKYFLAHSGKAYQRFKEAVPKAIDEDPELRWVGSTDITAYFDNILHSVLFEELVHAGVAGPALRSLRIMLSDWTPTSGMGLPQGPNAARLLGNFYLAAVDEEMTDDPSVVYLRYMDDVRILAPTKVEAVAALRRFEQLCRDRGLTLSSAKTSVDAIDVYNRKNEDGQLDRVASMFDKNAITKSRPELKKLLRKALHDNSINVRHARFSIWRLAKIRETGVLSTVLSKLELLAPVASPVAAYLKLFINKPHVQRRVTEFFENDARSYSWFLRSWVYAAMLEAKQIPADWRRFAESDAKNRNNPVFLRSVAACVMGKARVPRDLAWLKSQAKSDPNPEFVRALVVALAYGSALDNGTVRAVTTNHLSVRPTTDWLKGRVGLPSLIHPRQDIRIA